MAGVIDQLPQTGKPLRIDRAGISTPPGTWLRARNVRFNEDGSAERRPGLYSIHPEPDQAGQALYGMANLLAGDAPLRGLHEFDRLRKPGNTSRIFLAQYGDYLIGSHDGINFDMPLTQGVGADATLDFREFRDPVRGETSLIVFSTSRGWHPSYWNGRYDPHTNAWDRDGWEYFRILTTAPYASFGMVHNDRLWLSGGTNPFRVYYSAAGDFKDFAGGGYFDLDVRHGHVTSFFPTYYGTLLVGQEGAITRVHFDEYGDPAYTSLLTDEVGPVNNRSIARVGNDFLFLTTRDQVVSLATTEKYGDLLFSATSLSVHRQFSKRQRGGNHECFVVTDPENHIAWFGFPRGGCDRNDALFGYDSSQQVWLEDGNHGIGGFSCGSVWVLPHFNMKPKLVLGSYSNLWWVYFGGQPATPDVYGRMWFYRHDHKEDIYPLVGAVEADDDTCPLHLQGVVAWPHVADGALAWISADTGNYTVTGDYSGPAASTTIRLRCSTTGIINGGVGNGAVIDWEDINGVAAGSFNTDLWLNGHSMWLLPDIGLYLWQNGAAGDTIYEGQELWILVDTGRRITRVFYSNIHDYWYGLRWNEQGEGVSYNFLPELETADFKLAQGEHCVLLKGITVYTRAVGSKADIEEYVGDMWSVVDPGDRNDYRNFLDVYIQADQDKEWRHMAILDGNSAQRYHVDRSNEEETPGTYIARPSLALRPDATEAASDPLAKMEDVNMEFIAINRNVKTVRFRFDQATMATQELDTDVNNLAGSHSGDFCLVGFQLHIDASPRDMKAMGQGSMTITLPLEGV